MEGDKPSTPDEINSKNENKENEDPEKTSQDDDKEKREKSKSITDLAKPDDDDDGEPKTKKGKILNEHSLFRQIVIEKYTPSTLAGYFDQLLRISQTEYNGQALGLKFQIDLSLYYVPVLQKKHLFISISRLFAER